MDAGTLTKQRRDQTVYVWFRDKNTLGQKLGSAVTGDILIQKIEGGYPLFYNYQQFGSDCCSTTVPDPPPFIPVTLDENVFLALDDLFSYVAAQNLGPTKSSRIMYLWFHTVVSGYNWVSKSGAISGIKDNWNWDTRYPLTTEQDIFLFVNCILIDIMPTFVHGYNTDQLRTAAAKGLGYNDEQMITETTRVQSSGNYSAWQSAWNTWYTGRQSDGFVAAAAVPPDSALPNGSQTLEVTTTADDPNTFTDPDKWVPLRINGTKKNYLTYGWGDVASTILTAGQETSVMNTAQAFFPGTAATFDDGSDRAIEIAEVVSITGSLTDTQKMIAEFWAGGPNTVSPPCMFLWIWRYFMAATLIAHTRGFNAFFYSGLDLATHLFETGRLVWNLKKTNMEARPIQEIRRMYRGQTLTKYDGTPILGEAWIPYQESDFVTPPFPDFPSGHSAFSQSFASVMSDWFGETIPTNSVTYTNLNLICPLLQGSITMPFGSFIIPAKSSRIQINMVPSTALIFTYPTWQSMADEAGVSRKYGGIHATSAHTGSQALANALHTVLVAAWGISKS